MTKKRRKNPPVGNIITWAPSRCGVCDSQLGFQKLGKMPVCSACRKALNKPLESIGVLTELRRQEEARVNFLVQINGPEFLVKLAVETHNTFCKRLQYVLGVN